MKQIILLMALALGMCSINVNAQTKHKSVSPSSAITKTREVAGDGYIWYRLKKGELYGAEDIEGNTIIPIRYTKVLSNGYNLNGPWFTDEPYFTVFDKDFMGLFSREGKIIISTERHYTGFQVVVDNKGRYGYILVCKNGNVFGLCDLEGNEILPPQYYPYFENGDKHFPIGIELAINKGHETEDDFYTNDAYIKIIKDGITIINDFNGNELFAKRCESILVYPSEISCKINGKWQNYPAIKFANIHDLKFDLTNFSHIHRLNANSSSSSSTSSSSSSSSTASGSFSTGNSGNGTTQTVVVEHHRDPIPVQEWQACFGCGGMGTMGCDNCGGSGTKYIGDRLHRCSRCNGGGIIPCNICYGNKGQYITVYR